MIIDKSGGFASFEKPVTVVLFSGLWHHDAKYLQGLLSKTSSSDYTSEDNIFVTDSPKYFVNTFDIRSDCFHFILICLGMGYQILQFYESFIFLFQTLFNQLIFDFDSIKSFIRLIQIYSIYKIQISVQILSLFKQCLQSYLTKKDLQTREQKHKKEQKPYQKRQKIIGIENVKPFKIEITSLEKKQNSGIINHHRKKYLFIYVSPFFILMLIIIMQAWTDATFTWQNNNPPEYQLDPIPLCYGDNCLTLGYIVAGNKQPYIDAVLQHVKVKNNIPDDQIRQLKIQKEQILQDLSQHPNKTQSILIFCTNSSWKINGINIPCYADQYHLNFYTILYNISLNHRSPYMGNLKEAYPKDLVTIKLKQDVDEAILRHYTKDASISLSYADFPNRTSRFIEGISLFSNYGSFFLLIPYLILLVMQSSHLLHQKQKRLRIGLNIVGVTHLQYYLSEILTYGFSVFVISINFCIAGEILGLNFFRNSIFWFNFVILFMNGLILGLVSFNTMALVSQKSLGMSITYAFILYSISMQWIFSGGILFEFLYMDSASLIVKAIKYFFNLYPSFHFSKIFGNIARKADYHVDTLQSRYVEGSSFKFDDLFVQQSRHYQKPFPHGYVMPSTAESFLYLVLTSFIYIISLWIFDTFIQSNRGYSSGLFKSKKRKSSFYQLGQQDEEKPIVTIKNLQKSYDDNTYALRGISMQLKKGQIVGLLGQNGAGKSTLINILIGALGKSSGQVKIDGKNIDGQIGAIRRIIGVCPQFDILWQQLTAAEHVKMFCKLKGFPSEQIDIKKSLESVNLYDNRNGKVSTFSGGMRRRLSLAISLIGDPKLIILDQPTTGMDAHIRLLTWKLILKIRKNRTVLITTHNMQEAECLSDTIIIMSKGRLIVQGNSVQLKKSYGQGYVIHGYNKETNDEVSYKCTQQELPGMLEKISNQNIENWSLRQTTLEEVFLNVNKRY